MPITFAYVLISRSGDYYTEQLMLSIYSLLHYNTDANIVIVCDDETLRLTSGNKFLNSSHNIKFVSRTFDSNVNLKTRSRILKTTLRKLIKGDFLYIDCDTIICKSLKGIELINYDIAMVSDCNRKDVIGSHDMDLINRCRKINSEVDIKGSDYFNSGVIFARDVPKVHQFYECWYKNFLISEKNDLCFDQPALCISNILFSGLISHLPSSWNCQFKYGCSTKNAHILHYFNPFENISRTDSPFAFLLYDEIRERGFQSEYIRVLIENPASTLTSILQISKESFGSLCASPMTFFWFDRRRVFCYSEKFAVFLMKIFNIFRRNN